MTRAISRVLLVIPNSKWFKKETNWHLHPYALALIAAMIDQSVYQVRILDTNIDDVSPEAFKDMIRDWRPDIVGLSVLANEFGVTGHVGVRCVKEVSPDIVTVLGGVYPTTRAPDAIKDENLDFVVIGEGEFVFPALLEHLNGRGPLPDKGLAYRLEGRPVVQERADFIPDLNALPYPRYDMIDYGRYATQSFKNLVDAPRAFPYAKLITSRGCPIGCTFCQVETISGKRTRYQSASRVVDEIEWLVDTYGVRAVEFLDDNFLGSRNRARDIFTEMARRKVPVVWNAMNVSSFYLDDELLELMRASGCVFVSVAVESGSPRVLKNIIKKPVKLQHTVDIIAKAKELGMDTVSLWVIGFPGETWDEIRLSIRAAEMVDADYTKINVATPYPGTELFDMAVQGGYIDAEFDFDNLAWGEATYSTEEFTAAELTVLRAFEWDRINFADPDKRANIARMMMFSEEQLAEVRRKTRDNALRLAAELGHSGKGVKRPVLAAVGAGKQG